MVLIRAKSEAALLAVMNSTPVVDGVMIDLLDDPAVAPELVRGFGGLGSEADRLRAARDTVQEVVRGETPARALDEYLSTVVRRPSIADVVEWELDGPSADLPAARLILAWSDTVRDLPGRLRPCANPECTKFLIDHSKPNSARWCSMATCGNRLKARRHKERQTAAS